MLRLIVILPEKRFYLNMSRLSLLIWIIN